MTVYIAIPVMDEKEYLPLTLDCIVRQQCEAKVKVFICVNQPDDWWNQVDKRIVCTNNQETIRLLDNYPELDIELIDKSSRGKGWSSGKQGVGCARKALSDAVLSKASDNDILISMDADTIFEPTYCQSILTNFRLHKTAVGIAVPYCHPIADEEPKDRAMLRYEIYTRNYNLNLLRIGSPYAYTALGSAIACTIKACRAVGGFDTQKSGEDFYFLQKLCKYGTILRHNTDKVYPSVRFSSRVPFGTGPAIYRGSLGKWEAYPVFHHSGFDIVRDTYRQLDRLFLEDIDNEFTAFLQTIFSTSDLWTPLRKNYKNLSSFIRAFHHKADGLRIFQFVRNHQRKIGKSDERCLSDFIRQYYGQQYSSCFTTDNDFSFADASIKQLDQLRTFLMEQEADYQQKYDCHEI